jgi:hypothetical protein
MFILLGPKEYNPLGEVRRHETGTETPDIPWEMGTILGSLDGRGTVRVHEGNTGKDHECR